jgi:hypothetical protein
MNLVLTTAGSESSWNAVEEEDEAAAAVVVDRSWHRGRGEERASDEEASARAAGRNKEAVELCVLAARSACRPRSRALRNAVAVVVVVIMMMMMGEGGKAICSCQAPWTGRKQRAGALEGRCRFGFVVRWRKRVLCWISRSFFFFLLLFGFAFEHPQPTKQRKEKDSNPSIFVPCVGE